MKSQIKIMIPIIKLQKPFIKELEKHKSMAIL
jgi:hypothetical protein